MRLPNPLATPRGRLAAFFALYLTEGIPLGFTATAVATQMRRMGVGPAEIGAFVASLYLPWAFKWAFGPFVDVLSSDRFGRRRMWIVLAQVMMVGTLLAAMPVPLPAQLQLFTWLILAHNVFAATQDVAIDALAVNTLREDERGLANGLMFGGAYLGQAIGGSGALFLTAYTGFPATYFVVAAVILSVTLLVALPMREPPGPPRDRSGRGVGAAAGQVWDFIKESVRSFFGSRGAFLGLILALMPAGAYALGLALQSNLAVELGLNDTQVGWLSLWSAVISAVGCVVGGWLSDRFGRRRMLALYLVGTAIPTAALALVMHQHGWIMPVAPDAPNRPVPAPALVSFFWTAVLSYSVFQGLMYGTRTALFMDVTNPRVAATQFTAYMALLNFVISYSAAWQGRAVERWGYPVTLTIDAVAGLLCIALLPWMVARARSREPAPGQAIPEAVQP